VARRRAEFMLRSADSLDKWALAGRYSFHHPPSAACAKAFWSQQDCPPYQRLLADTLDWVAAGPQERWLDLGCGGGAVTRAIWERTNGTVAAIVGSDCAAANEGAYRRLRETLSPASPDRIQFIQHDFSSGLRLFADNAFDHAVSGLSITYAEFYDKGAGKWTAAAYDRVLAEVRRVIRPGGRFVFSVNVPDPSWARVAWQSLPSLFLNGHTLRSLKRSWRMLRYGQWLKREARTGRFHYLPADEVSRKLTEAGFAAVTHRLSYSDQAYIFRAIKPI
jgi:ubiquinone/menaquinone biosynthesis C-methylase UbiE